MHHRISSTVVCLATTLLVAGCAVTGQSIVPAVHEIPDLIARAQLVEVSAAADTSLTVMTLNAAHGRRNGIHQLLQTGQRHRHNLDRIVSVLQRERPQIVALQEADGPSLWSGGFSHVEYLAQYGGFGYYTLIAHDHFPGVTHGTALLSRLRLQEPVAVTFGSMSLAIPKGFLVSTIAWPGRPDVLLDIVSVHLDFADARVRERQIAELTELVARRRRPLVLMGDFNMDWSGRRELLPALCRQLGLSTFEPESKRLVTFPRLGRRLDWILVSRELVIDAYRTLPDVISDHRAVVGRLSLRRAAPR